MFFNGGCNQLMQGKTDLAVNPASGLCVLQIEGWQGDRGVDLAD